MTQLCVIDVHMSLTGEAVGAVLDPNIFCKGEASDAFGSIATTVPLAAKTSALCRDNEWVDFSLDVEES